MQYKKSTFTRAPQKSLQRNQKLTLLDKKELLPTCQVCSVCIRPEDGYKGDGGDADPAAKGQGHTLTTTLAES